MEFIYSLVIGLSIGIGLIIIYLLIQNLIFMFRNRKPIGARGYEEIPQVADLTVLNTFEIYPETRKLWEERMNLFRIIGKETGITSEDLQRAGWINDEGIELRVRIKDGLESQIEQNEQL